MSEEQTDDELTTASTADPEAPHAEPDAEEVPERVPDDWLDPKPFDPAGR